MSFIDDLITLIKVCDQKRTRIGRVQIWMKEKIKTFMVSKFYYCH